MNLFIIFFIASIVSNFLIWVYFFKLKDDVSIYNATSDIIDQVSELKEHIFLPTKKYKNIEVDLSSVGYDKTNTKKVYFS